MKILPVRAELFRAVGRTNGKTDETDCRSSQFCVDAWKRDQVNVCSLVRIAGYWLRLLCVRLQGMRFGNVIFFIQIRLVLSVNFLLSKGDMWFEYRTDEMATEWNTAVNLYHHNTPTWYNFLAKCFGRSFATIIRLVLYIVCLPCAYIMESHSAYRLKLSLLKPCSPLKWFTILDKSFIT
jgi:hypothetical protein